jgi:hypothetical protein
MHTHVFVLWCICVSFHKFNCMWVVVLLCINNYIHESHNMMLATIFISIHITYIFTFFICSSSFVVFGHWSFCINFKILQMIFTSMTLIQLVGISFKFPNSFCFGGDACLNSSHMLAQCEISFNNNQQCMKLKVAFFGMSLFI